MDETISGTNNPVENETPVDPWVAAFAALESKSEETSETDSSAESAEQEDVNTNADSADGQNATQVEDGNINADEDTSGGLDTSSGVYANENGESSVNAFDGMTGVNDEAIAQYEQAINDGIHQQAMNDIAQEFLKRNIRQRNGVLGATLDDEDICKRDSDGVSHFYNPETGREFTGDNPRRQAQEWVDDYNRALGDAFNRACEQYEKHLREKAEPSLAVMKFAPKYEKLDDIRRGMFDNVIEDYEIKDEQGKVIGYSCDLDKALALVDRQVQMIQSYAKQHQQAQQTEQPTKPALDMKTSSGAVPAGNMAPPSSLEEAMERIQDKELAKLKK